MPLEKPPRRIERTQFDRWLWDRGISNAQAGEELGCASESVRRYRLPFGDPGRRVPDDEGVQKIYDWTAGAVRPEHWYRLATSDGDDQLKEHLP